MTTALAALNPALAARIASKRKEIKAKTSRVDIIRPAAGKHKYRILPNHPGTPADVVFWVDFGRHYIKDTAGNMKAVYVCTEQTFGKPCAVCQEIARAGSHVTDDLELKALDESSCKRADLLVNALHLTSSDKAGVPQVLALSPTTFDKVLALMAEYGDITDLNNGIDIIIEREGTGKNTKYTVMPAARSNPVPSTVFDTMVNLHEFVEQESETELRKAIGAVNAIVGILDADALPVGTTARHAISSTATATASAAAAAASAAMDDELGALIEDAEFEPMSEARTGTDDVPFDVTPAATAAPSATDTTDIDALLAELG